MKRPGWLLIGLLPPLLAWGLSRTREVSVDRPFPTTELTERPCHADEIASPARDQEVTARVFAGAGVSDAHIEEQLARAAGYFGTYGLRFVQVGAVDRLAVEWMIGGTKVEIDDALRDVNIDPSKPAESAQLATSRDVVCKVSLAPLIAFVQSHAVEPLGRRVNIVVMRQLAASGSTMAGLLPHLRGLTISPHALPQKGLMTCLGLRPSTVPTVLISIDEIAKRKPGTVDVALAHELGHVFGLEHTPNPEDLMSTKPPTCLPPLSPTQWQAVRSSPFLAD